MTRRWCARLFVELPDHDKVILDEEHDDLADAKAAAARAAAHWAALGATTRVEYILLTGGDS